jgi:UDP-N-acetyl-D-mannosaminuronic acid dehydrogenase
MLYGLSRDDAKRSLRRGDLKITVFGLGKMGLPLALVFADAGGIVTGYDVSEDRVSTVNRGVNPFPFEPGLHELLTKNLSEGRFKATTDAELAVRDADLIVVLVPVKADAVGIDFTPLDDSMKKIGRSLHKGSIIVTETTLPPGTTESYIEVLDTLSGLRAGKDYGIAHAPERTMSGRVIKDITESYPKVIGAVDEKTLEPLIGIYSTINRKGVVPVSSIRIAEAVKVFEGVYRDVNIALANELAVMAEKMGFNAIEAIEAANTQPYSHIHRPGAGVGGHCIGVYTWFLIHKSPIELPILRSSRMRNDSMPHHMLELTMRALNQMERPIKGSRILVLGLSYRGGVKEITNSPSIPLIRELEDWGAHVEVHDPYFTDREVTDLGFRPFNNNYSNIDAIIVVTDHKEYKDLDLYEIRKAVRTPVIIDGRYIFINNPMIREYCYAAPGIGLRYCSN